MSKSSKITFSILIISGASWYTWPCPTTLPHYPTWKNIWQEKILVNHTGKSSWVLVRKIWWIAQDLPNLSCTKISLRMVYKTSNTQDVWLTRVLFTGTTKLPFSTLHTSTRTYFMLSIYICITDFQNLSYNQNIIQRKTD